MKSLVVFVAGALVLGAAALGVGYALQGDDALVSGGAGFALAFVPATLTLAWVTFTYRSTPEMRLLASMGGSGLRMAIGLGGGWCLTNFQPHLFNMSLWFWLLFFYLTLLALEIIVLVRGQPDANGNGSPSV